LRYFTRPSPVASLDSAILRRVLRKRLLWRMAREQS
jgi:hypothetical protein